MKLDVASVVLITACAPTALLAQPSDLTDSHKHVWEENIGWFNGRDAGTPEASRGLVILGDHLGGLLWGENVGWISLGSSVSSFDGPYANADGADHGVNLDPVTGHLSGYAWGENIGWINFGGGALATPAGPARIDFDAMRLRGYAWGENVGWINLDDPDAYAGLRCFSDFNGDDFVNGDDFDEFVALFELGDASTDINRDGFVNGNDFDEFVAAFVAGC